MLHIVRRAPFSWTVLICCGFTLAWQPSVSSAQTLEYGGFWENTTFGSTGPAAAVVEVNGPAVSFTLDLDGSVFGGTNPDPLVLTGTRDANNVVTFEPLTGHPTYGDVTGGMTQTGQITAHASNIPSPFIDSVDLTGQFTVPAIDLNYTVLFTPQPDAGQASGVIHLDLIPEPGSLVLVGLGGFLAFCRPATRQRRG